MSDWKHIGNRKDDAIRTTMRNLGIDRAEAEGAYQELLALGVLRQNQDGTIDMDFDQLGESGRQQSDALRTLSDYQVLRLYEASRAFARRQVDPFATKTSKDFTLDEKESMQKYWGDLFFEGGAHGAVARKFASTVNSLPEDLRTFYTVEDDDVDNACRALGAWILAAAQAIGIPISEQWRTPPVNISAGSGKTELAGPETRH